MHHYQYWKWKFRLSWFPRYLSRKNFHNTHNDQFRRKHDRESRSIYQIIKFDRVDTVLREYVDGSIVWKACLLRVCCASAACLMRVCRASVARLCYTSSWHLLHVCSCAPEHLDTWTPWHQHIRTPGDLDTCTPTRSCQTQGNLKWDENKNKNKRSDTERDLLRDLSTWFAEITDKLVDGKASITGEP